MLDSLLGGRVAARRALVGAACGARPERPARLPGLRARAPCSSAPRERLERARGGRARCLRPPTASGARLARFLPPDPSVSAPYRLTPGLAVRVGDPRHRRARDLRACSSSGSGRSQVLSGERYLKAAQNNQLRTIRVEAPRGPILDRHGRMIVGNVAGHGGEALGRRHARRRGRYADDQAPRGCARRRRCDASRSEVDDRRVDPLDADHREDGGPRRPGLLPATSTSVGVPGRRRSQQTYLRDYPYQSLAAQVLGYVGEISPEELKREAAARGDYRGGDKIGKSGVEAAFDGYLRGDAGARADPRRLARAGRREPLEIRRESQAGHGGPADDRHRAAARRRARDPRTGIALAHENKHCNVGRRRDRRARPARRRGARDGVVPDLQAVGLRRPHRPEEARAARERRGREEGELPGLNRVTQVAYPPGSTWKPVTALAAMQGAPPLAVRLDPVHGHAPTYGARQAGLQELGPVRRTGR